MSGQKEEKEKSKACEGLYCHLTMCYYYCSYCSM